MRAKWVIVVLAAIGMCAGAVLPAAAEEGYPLREKFPKVKWISTDALNKNYEKIIIVDVRSKTEFDVVHINKAVHVPITTALFGKDLEKVREKSGAVESRYNFALIAMPLSVYITSAMCTSCGQRTTQ